MAARSRTAEPFAPPGRNRRAAVAGSRFASAAVAAFLSLAAATPAFAKYDVDIDAPRSIRKLLKDHLDLARFAKRDDVSDDQFQFLVTATPKDVRDLVATEGYFTPVVRTDVNSAGEKRSVKVSVDPGPQTKVASVQLNFTGAVATEDRTQENAARFAFSINEGDAFSQHAWDDAKSAALRALQSRRYLGARIVRSQARINPRTQMADLSVTFDSGPTFTFGKLDISGTKRYPQKIIENVNPIHEGEIYDIARVNELQRQVQNTPYYASVAIDASNDVTKPIETPLHIKVSEYPYNSVRYGVGYATDTGFHIQGAYSYLNTFGAAYPFTISGRLDQTQQYGRVQLAMPPDSRGWVNAVFGSYTITDVSDTKIYSSRVGVQRSRSTQNIDTTYSLTFYDDRLTQNEPNPSTARALVPAWTWVRRDVDDPLFPRRGNVIRAEAGFAVKNVMTDQTFARLYANAQQYLPLGKSDLFVFRAEFGGVFTSGPSSGVPASLLFRAGGANSVRGYSYLGIGHNVAGSVLPTKYMVTGSSEYQHWFTHDWGGAVFFDIGTATDTWSERVFQPGVGVGARWRSPVGPVNVDVAYGLKNKSIKPYLTLGIAF
ncbi:autotransporter assembly complex protein TamA [Caballeronia sp. LZ062]|uniref:autotransporter assembly complex protein TamA n=1 Tax=unclassified Caballeronia TaxID=2646786 RepID=UPI002860AB73|nr:MULTISPECIES: autotransporter assembly complex family protein [unclassified Caballeronia]MDR5853861.1 autotransporter assembly complex protein TamA [Caballeronia sp. LZ050]MDR5871608.1 autotransporter assembly complex protein TamA [Caballeronia sp. LZ062]